MRSVFITVGIVCVITGAIALATPFPIFGIVAIIFGVIVGAFGVIAKD
jgi:tetrahydromethanopterin S-methyltransferase subunit E